MELDTIYSIKSAMYNIIDKQIENHLLNKKLLSFVDYQFKKGLPFGELLLFHYEMFNGAENEEIYSVAAAIELLILSSDILDDIQDGDTTEKPWSTQSSLALNATTTMLLLCIETIRKTNFQHKEKSISVIIEYSIKSITGQHKDLLNTCRTEETYLEMIAEKSGSLVVIACLVGTILASGEHNKKVEIYATYIGLIGQITNDLSDIQKWDKKNDVLSKKYSLPIIYLLNNPNIDIHFLHDYYNDKIDQNEIVKKSEQISEKFVHSGALIYSNVLKKIYQNKVLVEIENLNINKNYVNQLVKYI